MTREDQRKCPTGETPTGWCKAYDGRVEDGHVVGRDRTLLLHRELHALLGLPAAHQPHQALQIREEQMGREGKEKSEGGKEGGKGRKKEWTGCLTKLRWVAKKDTRHQDRCDRVSLYIPCNRNTKCTANPSSPHDHDHRSKQREGQWESHPNGQRHDRQHEHHAPSCGGKRR